MRNTLHRVAETATLPASPTGTEFAAAIDRIRLSRQSHQDWLEHFDAQAALPAAERCCDEDLLNSTVGDRPHQRQVIAEYDQVLDVLIRVSRAAARCGGTDPLGHPCALRAGHPPVDADRGVEHVCEHAVGLWPHLATWQAEASGPAVSDTDQQKPSS